METKYHIIRTEEELERLIDACKKTKYCSYDFETNAEPLYNQSFKVTLLSISFQPGFGCSIPLQHPETPKSWKWKKALLKVGHELIENPDVIKVAWNAKFDNQIWEKFDIYYRGTLIDGMLAKYILNEQRPNGLKDMVRRYLPEYGDYEKQDAFDKIPWDQKPLEQLCQYGCQDTDYTLRLTLFFEKKLIDLGLYTPFRNLMIGATRVLTSVEKTGLLVDVDLNNRLVGEYEQKIKDAENVLYNLPRVKKFTQQYNQQKINNYITSIEEEIEKLDPETQQRQIKSREDKIARIKAGEFTTKKEQELIRPLNFGSPVDLPAILFSKEGFNFKPFKLSDKGKPSTDEESLTQLRLSVKNPESSKAIFLDRLQDLRDTKHTYTTFIKGWQEKVQDDNRLHGKFNIHGTDSNRYSSNDPNCQQIPKTSVDPNVKSQLIAPPGKLWLVFDYSQCIDGESYIFCNTGIKKLKDIIPGKDKICMVDPQWVNHSRVLDIRVLANKGKAKCLKITTNTGRELILTHKHPVKSVNGFTLAKDLVPGDTLYIESFGYSKRVGNITLPKDEAYIAGLFYGDGHYPGDKSGTRKPSDKSICFATGSDREELRPILENYFQCKFNDPNKPTQGIRGSSYIVEDFRLKYPKVDSHSMRIPSRILESDWESKMNFIAGQIDSDGSIGDGRFRYTSVCKEYIYQLQILFQSVGFHGIIRKSNTKLNGKIFEAYHLIVQSTKAIHRLKKYLRLKRKIRDANRCIKSKKGAAPANKSSHCPTQRIPINVYSSLPRTDSFYKTYRNSLRKGRLIHSTLKPYLDELVELDSKWLDVYWYKYESVESIEEVGEREVYDIEVDKLHEFNPNGIRVHNCELRMMAHLSGDETYLRAFREGVDPHLSIAAKKYGVPIEEATKIYEDEDHPDHKLWKVRRKQAKQIAFGLIYGIGSGLLAVKLSDPKAGIIVSKEEAQKEMDEFFHQHPKILKFKEKQEKFIRKYGYYKQLFGTKRRLPEIYSNDNQEVAYAIRLGLNFPCQGAAANMTNFGAILIYWLMRQGKLPMMQEACTVHDALYMYANPEDINTWSVYKIWDILRNPQTKKYFGFEINDVDLDMDFTVGRTMAEELPFIPGYDYTKMLDHNFDEKEYMEEYKEVSSKKVGYFNATHPSTYPKLYKNEMEEYEIKFKHSKI